LIWLFCGAVFLPLPFIVLVVTGRLLTAMEDLGGAAAVEGTALAIFIVWILNLLGLLLVQSLATLWPPGESDED
jgi:hypothetical protein